MPSSSRRLSPYSQISLQDQCSIISAYEQGTDRNAVCDKNPSIDENNIKAVIRRYVRHWMQRLLSEAVLLRRIPDPEMLCGLFDADHAV